jgi:hypothetical protein
VAPTRRLNSASGRGWHTKVGRAVAALLVGASTVISCSVPDAVSDGSGSDGSGQVRPIGDQLSVQRSGYPPNGPAVGDPAALVLQPGGAPVRYRGSVVVPACELMTPQDVSGTGLLLAGGTATGLISRTNLDGQGGADLPFEPGSLIADDNTCHYVVGEDPHPGSVTVQVYQPAYVGPDALNAELRYRHRRSGSIGPVEVFEPLRPVGEFTDRWLRHRDVWVQLSLGPFPESVTGRLIDAVATRLPAVVANPSGPGRFGYRSPVFPVGYLNACEISTAEDFRAVFAVEPSPSVREDVAPGVGRIAFTGTGITANYVAHRCVRRATGVVTEASALTVRTTTFDSVEAARAEFALTRATGSGTDTPVRLVDESVFALVAGERAALFRAGLTIVDITLYDGPGRHLKQPLDHALLAVGAGIAARIAR